MNEEKENREERKKGKEGVDREEERECIECKGKDGSESLHCNNQQLKIRVPVPLLFLSLTHTRRL